MRPRGAPRLLNPMNQYRIDLELGCGTWRFDGKPEFFLGRTFQRKIARSLNEVGHFPAVRGVSILRHDTEYSVKRGRIPNKKTVTYKYLSRRAYPSYYLKDLRCLPRYQRQLRAAPVQRLPRPANPTVTVAMQRMLQAAENRNTARGSPRSMNIP
jgi:hypothetical protein